MPYKLHDTIPVWGQLQDSALQQIKNCLKHDKAVSAALMADHHHGYVQPIGGVIAYHEAISPSGVGYDIACGNKAVRLDISAIETRNNISTIISDITDSILDLLRDSTKFNVSDSCSTSNRSDAICR